MEVQHLSLLLSGVATFIAGVAFWRSLLHEIPTVEFLAERHHTGRVDYKLSVSNPTRRLLVLDHIRVHSPDTVSRFSKPGEPLNGTLHMAWDDQLSLDDRTKLVCLDVPAGETEYLEIEGLRSTNEVGFDVDFRLVWSKGIPFWDQPFMPRKVKLNTEQVAMRWLAAVTRGEHGDP